MAVAAYGGTVRANFSDLLEPGFREIFFNQFSELPTTYDKIFHVLDSKKQDETDSSVAGFGQLVETTEGSPVTYEDPLQGYDYTYTHKTFKKGFKITKEMFEDDQTGIMAKMPAALAKTTVRTVETLTADIFDDAFGAVNGGVGGDAKYLTQIGILKSSLINGENLKNTIKYFKATLNKALSQLQRLSEKTLFMSEAIVRTA